MSPNEFSGTLEFTHPVVRDVDKINCVLQCMAVTRVMALQVKNAPFLFIAIGLAPEKAVSRSHQQIPLIFTSLQTRKLF